MQKISMVLPYEFEIVFKSLPLADAGRLILAIYAYEKRNELPAFLDNPMLQFSWDTHIKPKVDENIEKYNATCEARRLAGSKGGKTTQNKANKANALFANQNEQKVANQADIDGDVDVDIDVDNSIKNTLSKPAKPQKHKYGSYANVLLSDTEMEKLKTEFPNDWQDRIERVSEYVASTGKHYSNYLATIRNWAKKDRPKVIPLKRNDVQSGLEQALALMGEQDG